MCSYAGEFTGIAFIKTLNGLIMIRHNTVSHQAIAVLLSTAFLGAVVHADEVIPADAKPQWFKGNLHTHTLWSDGNDFPDMVAEWYRTRGYNFLALSDHNVLSEGVRWVKVARNKGGKPALEKYLARFGPDWVETRGEPGSPSHEVRLKPLNEFRALVEERGKFIGRLGILSRRYPGLMKMLCSGKSRWFTVFTLPLGESESQLRRGQCGSPYFHGSIHAGGPPRSFLATLPRGGRAVLCCKFFGVLGASL